MAPDLVIGGAFTVDWMLPMYGKLLEGPTSVEIPASERYVPLPRQLLQDKDEMVAVASRRAIALFNRLERPMVGIGHSTGALVLEQLVMLYPDMFSDAVHLSGAHDGIKEETISVKGLAKIHGNREEYEHILHDSDHMVDHRQRRAEHWPDHVGLSIISTTLDNLVRLPHGLAVELANDKKAAKLVLGIAQPFLRLVPGMPKDAKSLSIIPFEHCFVPRHPAVIKYVRGVRLAAEHKKTSTFVIPDTIPESSTELVSAAA